MGLPSITISFIKKAVQSIKVGAGGIVGIVLTDTANVGVLVLKDVSDIPDTFSDANKAYIERAFIGAPKKVIVYTFGTTTKYVFTKVTPESGANPKTLGYYELNASGEYVATNDTTVTEGKDYYTRSTESVTTTLNDALKYFKINKANYICFMPDLTGSQATSISTWVKSVRANTSNRPVVVLPSTDGDHPAVINFSIVGASAGDCIHVGDTNYTEAEYCSRIAGLLAGLDLTVSATYKPLTEVTAIPEADSDDVDAAIDAGKLTLYNNGDEIVIARGVNSLTTVTQVYTEDLKKIKIVAIQDLIESDIYTTINKDYIGNYTNSYDNKCLLMVAIGAYLKKLDTSEGGAGYIAEGSTMEIDVAAQKNYLESTGVDTSEMDEQEIKEANTGSSVFLVGSVSILDAIEDVIIRINKV